MEDLKKYQIFVLHDIFRRKIHQGRNGSTNLKWHLGFLENILSTLSKHKQSIQFFCKKTFEVKDELLFSDLKPIFH